MAVGFDCQSPEGRSSGSGEVSGVSILRWAMLAWRPYSFPSFSLFSFPPTAEQEAERQRPFFPPEELGAQGGTRVLGCVE